MIEPLDTDAAESYNPRHIVEKLNEVIEAFNNHVHYARELQFPTSTPDEPNVFSEQSDV